MGRRAWTKERDNVDEGGGDEKKDEEEDEKKDEKKEGKNVTRLKTAGGICLYEPMRLMFAIVALCRCLRDHGFCWFQVSY